MTYPLSLEKKVSRGKRALFLVLPPEIFAKCNAFEKITTFRSVHGELGKAIAFSVTPSHCSSHDGYYSMYIQWRSHQAKDGTSSIRLYIRSTKRVEGKVKSFSHGYLGSYRVDRISNQVEVQRLKNTALANLLRDHPSSSPSPQSA